MKYIHVAKANCKNCYKCLKVCPVKSIKYSDGKVEVLDNACILCGRCIRNCPQKAKSLVHDIDDIKAMAADKSRKTIAALAPSYISSFGVKNRFKIVTALKKLGFTAVEETSVGAHAVTKEYARILEGGEMDNMLTTCCPSVVFLVQKYFPELTSCLAPVLSPMETHGLLLKKKWGDDADVIFFAPCISKIEEARIADTPHIDGVVTFKQLGRWLNEEGVEIAAQEDGAFGNDETYSAIYPVFEGILADVRANLAPDSKVEEKYTFMSLQGAQDVIEFLQEMQSGKIHGCFVEASACYGSCVNGPERISSEYRPINLSLKLQRYVKSRAGSFVKDQPTATSDELYRFIEPRPMHEEIPDEKTIREILAQIGKTSPEHELNCGSCGYRTCRDKAIAVYQGKAELYMCMPYMSQISETLANVTLSVSPDYIIAVNGEMKIRECNVAAQKLFGLPRNEIIGREIKDFLDPVDFAIAVEEQRSIPQKKTTYEMRGIIVNQTIIYVPEQNIAVAFLHDITKAERQTDKENKMKLDTMEMAQKVIDKQMTVAQEIASLLGETTAETKVTLTKLKDLIIYDDTENKDDKPVR